MATCDGCGRSFPSRNAVFKHLKETDGACLSKEDYKHFVRYVRKSVKPPKVVLLYGYLPYSGPSRIRNGEDAGIILLQAIEDLQKELDGFSEEDANADNNTNELDSSSRAKLNRSYGFTARSADCVQQDMDTGAVTEVLAVRLYPLRGDVTLDDWLDRVQKRLDVRFEEERVNLKEGDVDYKVTPIRILGRQDMPNIKFNAEMDVTFRRIEYLLPVDFLTWSIKDPALKEKVANLPLFASNHKHDIDHVNVNASALEESTRLFMQKIKNFMKLLTTNVVELDLADEVSVMEKDFSMKKLQQRKRDKNRRDGEKKKRSKIANHSGKDQEKIVEDNSGGQGSVRNSTEKPSKKEKKTNVLKRKRYHNFTERLMAHDYLTYRRLDRIYHRSTLRLSGQSNDKSSEMSQSNVTYMLLSISGDLFLTGQACRIVGILLALANGLVDPDFIDCVFDEQYPHLIPTPPAPLHGMISAEVHYANQEGKTKRILSPRVSKRFDKGWNNSNTIRRVKDWQNEVYSSVDSKWRKEGRDNHGRLMSEQKWRENVLLPWAGKANKHLEDYRVWKKTRGKTDSSVENAETNNTDSSEGDVSKNISSIPEIGSVDSTIPDLYKKVLDHLRALDSSGEWPSTSSKRQLVMISTTDQEANQQPKSLSMASSMARRNEQTNSSAYSFAEGQGGASGSFSVGIMPGGGNKQPKANSMFPDLVKAAFELETKLLPGREPSSTIAINRNAQFRPHTDSGAGAGQSTSLIVGLGTYAGGELMVEGEKHDIRYNAIEFDGWKQRHWTMPFKGERYSLVWFTPKGCEGMRGIDLEL